MSQSLHPMLNIAIKAARAAGAIINRGALDLDVLKVGRKGPNDFVSDVDRAAEQAVIDILLEAYPSHGILAGALNVQITTSLVGASAGVFGVLMACAYIAPKTIVQLIFPPIPIQMRYLVYGFFALSVWNLVIGSKNQGGEAAHVGGALAGYFFIRRAYLLNDFFEVFRRSTKPRQGTKRHRAGVRNSDAEIDSILDKISRDGIAGLSDEERKRLAEHSKSERQDRSH